MLCSMSRVPKALDVGWPAIHFVSQRFGNENGILLVSPCCQHHYPSYYTHMLGNYYKPNCGFLGACRVWRSGILWYLWLVRIEETQKEHGNDHSGESNRTITSNMKWKLGSYGDDAGICLGMERKWNRLYFFGLYQNFFSLLSSPENMRFVYKAIKLGTCVYPSTPALHLYTLHLGQ